MKSIALLSAVFVASLANEIEILNNCSFTIWPGILGNPGKGQPYGGGFGLGAQQSVTMHVANDWGGRIWARTNCGGNKRCETGDCGGRIQCNGAAGVPPASLVEVTLSGLGGLDYYDISLVDGHNLPIRMQPTSGFKNSEGGPYYCKPAGCYEDLNAKCPPELATKNSTGWTVSCKSACLEYNTDQYCCQGAYNKPETCKSIHWPVNYPAIFKSACPHAYSYAYDDTTSTFSCRGDPQANYRITFCP